MTQTNTLIVPAPKVLLEALTSISQGVLVAGPDLRLTFCNQGFSTLTGYDACEIIGRSCDFLQGPGTDPTTIRAIRDALDGGQDFSGIILNYRKNGEPFWNDLSITTLRNDDGGVSHFLAVIRDITARKEAEDALRSAQNRQTFLFDRIQAGIVSHSLTGAILYANATAAELLGVSSTRLCDVGEGGRSWEFIREDGSQMPSDEYPVNRAIATRATVSGLVLGIRRGGQSRVVWVMCNAYPVLDSAQVLHEVLVSFTEITELKQAERALQKSEERLRLVLQGSTDAPWDWDLITNALHYEPRWWQMLGREPDEMPSTASLWMELLHPEDAARVGEQLADFLANGPDSYETEFRLHHKDGHYVPVLSRGFILRDKLGRAIRVSGTNTDLTDRKLAEQRIHQLAFYDALTRLPNRRLLMEQLRKSVIGGARTDHGALLFIDLDNFKILNDTLGHDMGDLLLQYVAKRLKENVRDADVVARLGGDEFVVMLERLPDRARDAALVAQRVGEKIVDALARPYDLAGTEYCLTASVGITLFGDSEKGVDTVLKQADLAMYQAKASGRNALRFFDAKMQTAIDERLALETDLRRSLQNNELLLNFQPQVDAGGDVIGAEVLVRWHQPERGLVSPSTFIPVAESTGLILALGRWVLRESCAQLARWAEDPIFADLTLSVNVSVRQIREDDFPAQVLAAISETGADPTRLKLELTESLLAEDIDQIIAKMTVLKAHGIRFSLDDFGTGYSSLGYLQRLPLDELKIDRSFVRDVLTNGHDSAIARIIISLAETLGLNVVAEGVETEGQRRFLAENGCSIYQGYLFGRPLPLARFEATMLAARAPIEARRSGRLLV